MAAARQSAGAVRVVSTGSAGGDHVFTTAARREVCKPAGRHLLGRQGATPMKPRHPSSSRELRLRPDYRAGEDPSYLERLARVFLYVLVIAAALFVIGAGLGGGF